MVQIPPLLMKNSSHSSRDEQQVLKVDPNPMLLAGSKQLGESTVVLHKQDSELVLGM